MSAKRPPFKKQSPNLDEYVAVGAIAQAHGIHGEVRVHQFNPESEVLWEVDAIQLLRKGKQQLERIAIKETRPSNKGPLLLLEGCNTRNKAELLRGSEIYLHQDDMPDLEDEEYYYYQMEGLPVFHTHTGESLGVVVRIIPSPAQDLMVVLYDHRQVLIPVVEELIPVIDLEAKRVEVDPIPGLFEKES